MSNTNEAIIEFDIILNAKLSEETRAEINKLEKLQSEQEKTETKQVDEKEKEAKKKAAADEEKETPEKDEKEDENNKDKEKKLAKLDPDVQAFLNDPKSFITSNVSQELQHQFEDVLETLPAIAIAIIAIKVGEKVLELMTQKGGPLNRDFHRFIDGEINVGLTRLQQKQKELGIMQDILTQVQGFNPNNENWTYNSLFNVNDSRLARIGLSDRESGSTMMIPR